MFKHYSATVNRFAVATMTKIAVYRRKLTATSALLRVKMFFFVVGVDDTLASVTPNGE